MVDKKPRHIGSNRGDFRSVGIVHYRGLKIEELRINLYLLCSTTKKTELRIELWNPNLRELASMIRTYPS